jgi:hypothetical protein
MRSILFSAIIMLSFITIARAGSRTSEDALSEFSSLVGACGEQAGFPGGIAICLMQEDRAGLPEPPL